MKRWSFLILVVVAVVAMTSIAYNRPTAVEQPKETIATATNSAITKPQSSETSIVNPEPVAPVRISPTTRNLLSELQDYQECYFRSDCVTPESDARAAHFFVAQQITDRLDRLVALTHQQTTSDDAIQRLHITARFHGLPRKIIEDHRCELLLNVGWFPKGLHVTSVRHASENPGAADTIFTTPKVAGVVKRMTWRYAKREKYEGEEFCLAYHWLARWGFFAAN